MRSRTVVVTCLAALLAAGAALAGGTVEEATFISQELGTEVPVRVYLPEGYSQSTDSYPVMLILTDPLGTDFIAAFVPHLDRLIGNRLIKPMIAVAVSGMCTPYADWNGFPAPMSSWWRNSELGGAWQDMLLDELVPWLDESSGYRTRTDAATRYLVGYFMGGGASMMTALEFPDTFGAVAAANGNGTLEVYRSILPYMLATEYPLGPPYTYHPTAGPFSFYNFMLAAAFAPNTTDPSGPAGWPVDFWLDVDGQVVEPVWQRLVDQTSPSLAAQFAQTGEELRIFFDCDVNDITPSACTVLDSTMNELGVAHVRRWYSDQAFEERAPIYITFLHPLKATAESPNRVFNPNRWWPMQEFVLELPGDLEAELFDLDTIVITAIDGVELDEPLQPLVAHDISDVNGNGRTDLTIWFARWPLRDAMAAAGVDPPGEVVVTLRGETTDELFWEATETLFVPNLAK